MLSISSHGDKGERGVEGTEQGKRGVEGTVQGKKYPNLFCCWKEDYMYRTVSLICTVIARAQ